MATKRIGVLALQGDYEAHLKAVHAAGGLGFEVRTPEELATADGLIIPGGESTTMGHLMARFGMDTALKAFGKPIWGTCAGMIVLAQRITAGEKRGGQPLLGLMDIAVERNAFGRQIDSFETDIETSFGTVRGVFIRAPFVSEVGEGVEVLARYQDRVVLVRQGKLLASAFHPELTDDPTLHRAFIEST
ncbi:pyridoxal 5'-phosphate synthase glutaminase subunit PdxT [Armatimonas rosea]|uniref:Pyridoxal 5'-phosphate synthase subunit PdxT n=1 Tax=Armatimonas rosea TaxID=685828 RepID=A0A7W9SPA4_ARMRO|nr:5'-phosphate synthase pdxT subunit [Armatimonas rosea]